MISEPLPRSQQNSELLVYGGSASATESTTTVSPTFAEPGVPERTPDKVTKGEQRQVIADLVRPSPHIAHGSGITVRHLLSGRVTGTVENIGA